MLSDIDISDLIFRTDDTVICALKIMDGVGLEPTTSPIRFIVFNIPVLIQQHFLVDLHSDFLLELYDVIDDGQCEKAKQILESMPDPYSIINQYYRGPNTLLYR